jgi:hypothetical protein
MLIVLTFIADQVQAAERLVDFIHFIHGKQKAKSILLVAGNDVHEEWKTKIRLSSEVAFTNVELITADPKNLFSAAMEHVEAAYKEPWILLEPDCVPLVPMWIALIEDAYNQQSKKIMGPYLKNSEKTWLARQAVYPADINRFSSRDLTPLSSMTRVIQLGKYEKREDVRDKSNTDWAYLFCGDKTGELMRALRSEMKK